MKKKIIVLLLVAICLTQVLFFYRNKMIINKKEYEGIDLLRRTGLDLFWIGGALYKLNINNKEWEIIPTYTHVAATHPQDADINNQTIVYRDFTKSLLRMESLIVSEEQKTTETNIPAGASNIKLSHNNEMIAYTRFIENTPGIFVYDRKEAIEFNLLNISGVNSLDWSFKDDALFYSVRNEIYRLDMQSQVSAFITNGFWVFCLYNNVIGFCRNVHQDGKDYTIIFCYDLQTRECREVFRTKQYILGMDWDHSGRYNAMSVSTIRFHAIFIPEPICLVLLCDTETGQQFNLPRLPSDAGKSGCILFGN